MTTDRRLIKALIDKVNARRYRRDNYKLERGIGRSFDLYQLHSDINQSIKLNMVDIYNNDLFEIYTYNSNPVESDVDGGAIPAGTLDGWEIKWILAPNKEVIKQYPFFDCIISINDNSTGQATDAELFTV